MKKMSVLMTMLLCSILPVPGGASIIEFSPNERFVLTGFPGDGNFARVSDMTFDVERGLILVADEGRKRIYEFRSDGTPDRALGVEIDLPAVSRIAAGTGDRLFLMESSTGKVFSMDRLEKEELKPLAGGNENSAGIFARAVAAGPNGTLYLVDQDGRYLKICDRDGELLASNKSRVALRSVVSMDIDERGRVVIATREMNPLHLFDSTGNYSRRVEIRDLSTDVSLSDIGGVAVDRMGRIWLTYPRDGLVRIFDETGSLLSEIDETAVPGGLFSPTDIEITPMGDVLILERGTNTIRCFTVDIR